jgi:hypothetical protein
MIDFSDKHKADEQVKIIEQAVEDLKSYISRLEQEAENKKTTNIQTLVKSLNDICEKLHWGVYDLNYYRNRLYKNRGRVSSDPDRARRQAEASRENGKLGGRPPKEISEAKRRFIELLNKAEKTDSERNEIILLMEKLDSWNNRRKDKS